MWCFPFDEGLRFPRIQLSMLTIWMSSCVGIAETFLPKCCLDKHPMLINKVDGRHNLDPPKHHLDCPLSYLPFLECILRCRHSQRMDLHAHQRYSRWSLLVGRFCLPDEGEEHKVSNIFKWFKHCWNNTSTWSAWPLHPAHSPEGSNMCIVYVGRSQARRVPKHLLWKRSTSKHGAPKTDNRLDSSRVKYWIPSQVESPRKSITQTACQVVPKRRHKEFQWTKPGASNWVFLCSISVWMRFLQNQPHNYIKGNEHMSVHVILSCSLLWLWLTTTRLPSNQCSHCDYHRSTKSTHLFHLCIASPINPTWMKWIEFVFLGAAVYSAQSAGPHQLWRSPWRLESPAMEQQIPVRWGAMRISRVMFCLGLRRSEEFMYVGGLLIFFWGGSSTCAGIWWASFLQICHSIVGERRLKKKQKRIKKQQK